MLRPVDIFEGAGRWGSGMELRVRYYKDGQSTEEDLGARSFEEAKAVAFARVKDGSADSAEIWNSEDEMLFDCHSGD
jgi:hypothetical protein